VEISSPGLTGATATIDAKAVKLRPQVVVWDREVPTGPGITGLWRPVVAASVGTGGDPMALGGGGGDMVFTLRQEGNAVAGLVESGAAPGIGGGATGGAIEDGKVDGPNVTFRVGTTTYSGTFNGSQVELRRSGGQGGRGGRGGGPAANTGGPRPAIGPPPDGSDPSFGAGGPGGGRGGQQAALLTLRRVTR
jgi:beta-galactosidase